jgi:Amt family ammonium transporter
VGVDLSLHAETAYEFGVGGHGGSFHPLHDLITGKPKGEGSATATSDSKKADAAAGKESVEA